MIAEIVIEPAKEENMSMDEANRFKDKIIKELAKQVKMRNSKLLKTSVINTLIADSKIKFVDAAAVEYLTDDSES